MKLILGGVAIAALVAGSIPAIAQTDSGTKHPAPSSVQSGAPMKPEGSGTSVPRRHADKSARTPNDKGPTPDDNIADQLNRQELQQLGPNGGAASGSTTR